MSLLIATTVVIFALWIINRIHKIGSREQGLPPGPPTLPLIGNLHLLPKTRTYSKYERSIRQNAASFECKPRFNEWAGVYGGMYSVKIGPKTIVFISSPKCARECFELNSGTTSDRPDSHISNLLYRQNGIITSRYGPYWKSARRATHRLLSKEACNAHLLVQRAEASLLMDALLDHSQSIYHHIQRYATSVALELVFGTHCPTHDDPIIKEYLYVNKETEYLTKPGEHPPIDVFTFLRYVPERWASWKGACNRVRNMQRKFFLGLMDRCLARVRDDKRNGSFMEDLLDNEKEYGFDRENLLYIGLSLIFAGADTTAAYIQFFVLCMLENPEVFSKAQQEIDDVVGHNRTPELEDMKRLPYIQAIISELHRYRPIAPTSIPHCTTGDTMVGGYLIPRETTIIMNIWSIGREKELFEDPERFWPERFIKSEFGTKPDADTAGFRETPFSFGGGRRICPGMHLASNSIALNVMNLLWAFELEPAKDDLGLPIPLSANDTTDGALLIPKPFTCNTRPRSSAKVDMIKKQFETLRPVLDRFEQFGKGSDM